jgi:hypothetical protein
VQLFRQIRLVWHLVSASGALICCGVNLVGLAREGALHPKKLRKTEGRKVVCDRLKAPFKRLFKRARCSWTWRRMGTSLVTSTRRVLDGTAPTLLLRTTALRGKAPGSSPAAASLGVAPALPLRTMTSPGKAPGSCLIAVSPSTRQASLGALGWAYASVRGREHQAFNGHKRGSSPRWVVVIR